MEVYERRHHSNTCVVICVLQDMGIAPQDEVFIDTGTARGGHIYLREPNSYSLLNDLEKNGFSENSLIKVWEF